MRELSKANNEIKIIGTRHGEKLYETLLTREELAGAEDCGDYYRIIPDTRSLNYKKYFVEGEVEVSTQMDYNLHNTRRLSVDEIKELMLKKRFVQVELGK
jgi:UDP-glucose 4-epimerase